MRCDFTAAGHRWMHAARLRSQRRASLRQSLPRSQRSVPDGRGDAASADISCYADSPTEVSSVCDHPYFPVRASARWSYRVQGSVASSFAETHVPASSSSFVTHTEFPDVSADNEWRCGAEGLTALQASRLSAAQTQLRFVSTGVTGVTIPPPDRWTPGSSWTTVYDVDGDPGAGGNLARGRITISNTIDGEESVSVPAGHLSGLEGVAAKRDGFERHGARFFSANEHLGRVNELVRTRGGDGQKRWRRRAGRDDDGAHGLHSLGAPLGSDRWCSFDHSSRRRYNASHRVK